MQGSGGTLMEHKCRPLRKQSLPPLLPRTPWPTKCPRLPATALCPPGRRSSTPRSPLHSIPREASPWRFPVPPRDPSVQTSGQSHLEPLLTEPSSSALRVTRKTMLTRSQSAARPNSGSRSRRRRRSRSAQRTCWRPLTRRKCPRTRRPRLRPSTTRLPGNWNS